MASYAGHGSQFFGLQGAQGWAEMEPAFGYNGSRLRLGSLDYGKTAVTGLQIARQDQFAREIGPYVVLRQA